MLKVKFADTKKTVCKGVMQREGVDFLNLHTSCQICFYKITHYCCSFLQFKLVHMDVITAFHNPDVKEEIHEQFPEGLGVPKRNKRIKTLKLLFASGKVMD